jgi:hypothetical protein
VEGAIEQDVDLVLQNIRGDGRVEKGDAEGVRRRKDLEQQVGVGVGRQPDPETDERG